MGSALKGAEPKFKTDSEGSSSAEEGDSGTRSSFDDEHRQETDDPGESCDGEDGSQQEEDLAINIPEAVKKVLEEDYFFIKHYKKVFSFFILQKLYWLLNLYWFGCFSYWMYLANPTSWPYWKALFETLPAIWCARHQKNQEHIVAAPAVTTVRAELKQEHPSASATV